MTSSERIDLEDLFIRHVDGSSAQFVRPAGTNRPIWAVYTDRHYQGTISAEQHAGEPPRWRILTTQEEHTTLENAVRALRRPPSWPQERTRITNWARDLLADDSLLIIDMEPTRPDITRALRVAAIDIYGASVLDGHLGPEFLPVLSTALTGRTLVAYDAATHHDVLVHEISRHPTENNATPHWLSRLRWQDAKHPCAVWKGLWSAEHGTYHHQAPGGRTPAANCHLLLAQLETMSTTPPIDCWC